MDANRMPHADVRDERGWIIEPELWTNEQRTQWRADITEQYREGEQLSNLEAVRDELAIRMSWVEDWGHHHALREWTLRQMDGLISAEAQMKAHLKMIRTPKETFAVPDAVLAQAVAADSQWTMGHQGEIHDTKGMILSESLTSLGQVIRALGWVVTNDNKRDSSKGGILWENLPASESERAAKVRSIGQMPPI